MQHPFLYLLMFIAGIGIPVMAALNAGLGQHLRNPIAAVSILCLVASVAAITLLLSLRQPINWSGLSSAPPYLFIGGFLFILYIGSITYSAPKIGLANSVLMVLVGQLVCAAAIDHFGLFGAQQFTLNLKRIAGFGTLAVGFWLVVVK